MYVCVSLTLSSACIRPVKRRRRPRVKHFNEGDETPRKPERISDQATEKEQVSEREQESAFDLDRFYL